MVNTSKNSAGHRSRCLLELVSGSPEGEAWRRCIGQSGVSVHLRGKEKRAYTRLWVRVNKDRLENSMRTPQRVVLVNSIADIKKER